MSDAFDDAVPTGRFLIEVDGLEIGKFNEVSGLSVDVNVETLEEGGENQFVHKLPGRLQWPNVVLKRGVTKSDNLFGWLSKTSGEGYAGAGNKLERKSAAIVLLGTDGKRLRSWELSEAFAVKWSGPSFAATATEAATEELEIAHHGFKATGS